MPKSPVLTALRPSRLKKPTWKAAEADPLVPRTSVSSAIKHFFAPNKSNTGPAQASSTSIATPKPTVKKRSILGKKKSTNEDTGSGASRDSETDDAASTDASIVIPVSNIILYYGNIDIISVSFQSAKKRRTCSMSSLASSTAAAEAVDETDEQPYERMKKDIAEERVSKTVLERCEKLTLVIA